MLMFYIYPEIHYYSIILLEDVREMTLNLADMARLLDTEGTNGRKDCLTHPPTGGSEILSDLFSTCLILELTAAFIDQAPNNHLKNLIQITN